jgi:hypothetical protein
MIKRLVQAKRLADASDVLERGFFAREEYRRVSRRQVK